MSGDRIDLLAEIHRLKEENKELRRVNKLKHELYQEQKERADMLNKALDKAIDKIVEILTTVDSIYDCKMICDKGNTPCNNQCLKKEFWKEWCLNDE